MSQPQKRKTIALGVLKDSKNRILIIQRTNPERAQGGRTLTWAFPGGEVEGDVDPKMEVYKEFLEETGYKVKVGELISQRDYDKPFVHLLYYACESEGVHQGIVENMEEVDRLKWVEIPNLTKFFTTDIDPGVAVYLGLK